VGESGQGIELTQDNRAWPPLVWAPHQPAWVRARDFLLTGAMWLLLAMMLNNEFELFLGVYLERLGSDAWLHRLGLLGFDPKLDWFAFGRHLLPYLFVVFVLVASLTTFAAHTLLRRQSALREAKPQSLSFDRQARHAALPPMAAGAGVASREGSANLDDRPVVDGRSLLAILNGQDKDALAKARAERIVMVRVMADGRYRIERAASAMPEVESPP
jgi:hypothetical protein